MKARGINNKILLAVFVVVLPLLISFNASAATSCQANADCSMLNGCWIGTCININYSTKIGECANWGNKDCGDGLSCTTDSCNVLTGECVNTSQCDDADACTYDMCTSTGCTHRTIGCSDDIACTKDSCDKQTGCVNTPDASLCSDDNLTCTTKSCDAKLGCVQIPDDSKCNDGNSCTTSKCDKISGCLNSADPTQQGLSCTINTDPSGCVARECSGAGCNVAVDNTRCLIDFTCYQAGERNPSNDCQACVPEGNPFAWVNRGQGNACQLANKCTVGASCSNLGTCIGGDASCNDDNECTTDSCDQAVGCYHENLPDGTKTASGKYCYSGYPLGCINDGQCADDGDSCTANHRCDVASNACVFELVANGTSCEKDGNQCTKGACLKGVCSNEVGLSCNDNNACTADLCAPATGCLNQEISCDDNNACTADSCSPTTGCMHRDISASCNDGNDCSVDTCDPASGCNHEDNDAYVSSESCSCPDGSTTCALNAPKQEDAGTMREGPSTNAVAFYVSDDADGVKRPHIITVPADSKPVCGADKPNRLVEIYKDQNDLWQRRCVVLRDAGGLEMQYYDSVNKIGSGQKFVTATYDDKNKRAWLITLGSTTPTNDSFLWQKAYVWYRNYGSDTWTLRANTTVSSSFGFKNGMATFGGPDTQRVLAVSYSGNNAGSNWTYTHAFTVSSGTILTTAFALAINYSGNTGYGQGYGASVRVTPEGYVGVTNGTAGNLTYTEYTNLSGSWPKSYTDAVYVPVSSSADNNIFFPTIVYDNATPANAMIFYRDTGLKLKVAKIARTINTTAKTLTLAKSDVTLTGTYPTTAIYNVNAEKLGSDVAVYYNDNYSVMSDTSFSTATRYPTLGATAAVPNRLVGLVTRDSKIYIAGANNNDPATALQYASSDSPGNECRVGAVVCEGSAKVCSTTAYDPGTTIECGFAACRTSIPECLNGVKRGASACVPDMSKSQPEICNGTDDNCNGQVDEGFVSTGTTCGTGACAAVGATSCVNGSVVDSCAAGKPAENDATCDGRDDDCSGQNDEDYVGTPITCGLGECVRSGLTSCVAGQVVNVCTPGAPEAAEFCDALPGSGKDENCNGLKNEGCFCVNNATRACGTDAGECVAGTETCVGGNWNGICAGSVGVMPEKCDGKDNDCDGVPDNGFDVNATCSVGSDVTCAVSGKKICDAEGKGTICSVADINIKNGTACTNTDSDLCTDDKCLAGECATHTKVDCNDSDVCTKDSCQAQTGCSHTTIDCADTNGCTIDSCNKTTGCSNTPISGFNDICFIGEGECRSQGKNICDGNGGLICDATKIDPKAETCNGLDDDCNGVIDDNITDLTSQSCGSGGCLGTQTRTCNGVSGMGQWNACSSNTKTCEEGDLCTTGDKCDSTGTCVKGTGALVCNDNSKCTTDSCEPTTGCVYKPIEIGDGDLCTTDSCNPLTGLTHAAIECKSPPNCRDAAGATCNSTTGQCEYPEKQVPKNDSTCLENICDPSDGIVKPTVSNNGGACDDKSPCTEGDVCSDGKCAGVEKDCSDGITCSVDSCNGATGKCEHVSDPDKQNCCSPGELGSCYSGKTGCTIAEGGKGPVQYQCTPQCASGLQTCGLNYEYSGACVGEITPKAEVCNGLDDDCNGVVDDNITDLTSQPCGSGDCLGTQTRTCNGVRGMGQWNACSTNGAKCEDGDQYTTNDSCLGGGCQPGGKVACLSDSDCDDKNECTINKCIIDAANPAANKCDYQQEPPVITDVGSGVCAYKKTTTCTTDRGHVVTGSPPELCSDGNACTLGDHCDVAGTCVAGGETKVCDDGVACTTDSCNPTTGACESSVVTSSCLIGGACVAVGKDPANECQKCDPAINPKAWTITAGVSCTNKDLCTIDSKCQADASCLGRAPTEVGKSCTNGLGICAAAGVNVCDLTTGVVACNASAGEKGVEKCDGLDNDCDGLIDDDIKESLDCGKGVCIGGKQTRSCVQKTLIGSSGEWTAYDACSTDSNATAEKCNGLDDDCDGSVDEDFTDLTKPCQVGAGICLRDGTFVCDAATGGVKCGAVAGNPEASEVCDDKKLDENCDGKVDESCDCVNGQIRECGQNNTGQCKMGTQTCRSGTWDLSCAGEALPQGIDDNCNGLDDDCDGQIDEMFPVTATTCGKGACAATGTNTCIAGKPVDSCKAGTLVTSDDNCDAIDNDCDGSVDEDYKVTDTKCGSGDCVSTGKMTCAGGVVTDSCVAKAPQEEICDGLDNDCDTQTDELDGMVCYTGSESTRSVGECGNGVKYCVNKEWSECQGQVLPSEEICDGLDNDCDGVEDNNAKGVGSECTSVNYGCKGVTVCSENGLVCDAVENGCGGCGQLAGKVGDTCIENCKNGNLECRGKSLECISRDEMIAGFGDNCGTQGACVLKNECGVGGKILSCTKLELLENTTADDCEQGLDPGKSEDFTLAETRAVVIHGITKSIAKTVNGSDEMILGFNENGGQMISKIDTADVSLGAITKPLDINLLKGIASVKVGEGVSQLYGWSDGSVFALRGMDDDNVNMVVADLLDITDLIYVKEVVAMPNGGFVIAGKIKTNVPVTPTAPEEVKPPAVEEAPPPEGEAALTNEVPADDKALLVDVVNESVVEIASKNAMIFVTFDSSMMAVAQNVMIEDVDFAKEDIGVDVSDPTDIRLYAKGSNEVVVAHSCKTQESKWACAPSETVASIPIGMLSKSIGVPMPAAMYNSLVGRFGVSPGKAAVADKSGSIMQKVRMAVFDTAVADEFANTTDVKKENSVAGFFEPYQKVEKLDVKQISFGNVAVLMPDYTSRLIRRTEGGEMKMIPATVERLTAYSEKDALYNTSSHVFIKPHLQADIDSPQGANYSVVYTMVENGRKSEVLFIYYNKNESPQVEIWGANELKETDAGEPSILINEKSESSVVDLHEYYALALDPSGDAISVEWSCADSEGSDCASLMDSSVGNKIVLKTDTTFKWPVTLSTTAKDTGGLKGTASMKINLIGLPPAIMGEGEHMFEMRGCSLIIPKKP